MKFQQYDHDEVIQIIRNADCRGTVSHIEYTRVPALERNLVTCAAPSAYRSLSLLLSCTCVYNPAAMVASEEQQRDILRKISLLLASIGMNYVEPIKTREMSGGRIERYTT